jgi:hypothetical protein
MGVSSTISLQWVRADSMPLVCTVRARRQSSPAEIMAQLGHLFSSEFKCKEILNNKRSSVRYSEPGSIKDEKGWHLG